MEEKEIGIKDILAALKRRKWVLIIPFFIILITSALTAWLIPSTYRSTAKILIEQRAIPSQYVISSQTTFAEQRMQNIKQRTLTSKQLLALIKQFNLYKNKKKKTRDEILNEMRKRIRLEPVSVKIVDQQKGKNTKATIAFTLSFEYENPLKAQQVTDRLVTLFLKEDLKERTEQAVSTYAFLQDEKDKIKADLDRTEIQLADFKRVNANALPELFQFNMQTFNNIELTIKTTKQRLRVLKEKKITLEEQLAAVPSTINREAAADTWENEDKKRLAFLEMELINLRTKYSDLYPDVKKLKQEIKALTQSSEADDKNAQPSEKDSQRPSLAVKNPAHIALSAKLVELNSDMAHTKNELKELAGQAKKYSKRISTAPKIEATYNELVAERTNLTSKYREMQAKMLEAKVAQALESEQKGERFALVEAASFPEKPFKPNRLGIFMVGFIIAIGGAAGMVILVEFYDDSIRDPWVIERISGLPVLTTIPRIITQEDRAKADRHRVFWLVGSILASIIAVFLFHLYVMNLDIFFIKVLRKIS